MSFSQDSFIAAANEQKHSEEFIQECLAYAANLQSKNLPVIFSTDHLRIMLNEPELKEIIDSRNFHYRFYQIKKRSGQGFRQIVVPFSRLKRIQRFILSEILTKVEVSAHA